VRLAAFALTHFLIVLGVSIRHARLAVTTVAKLRPSFRFVYSWGIQLYVLVFILTCFWECV